MSTSLEFPWEGSTGGTTYLRGRNLFTQGQPSTDVWYVQQGAIQLSVVSGVGRQAVVGILTAGDFLGEDALILGSRRGTTAKAITASTVVSIKTSRMHRLFQEHRGFSARFLSHMLARNARMEADLADQLLNGVEKRLARALMLLAPVGSGRTLPKISQETLAEMIGSTRSEVNRFLRAFEKRGLIRHDGRITVEPGLGALLESERPHDKTG